jgi:hypothetical protein
VVRALDSRDILWLWDTYAPLHPIDRTLAMLRAGDPETPLETLAALPIGERERRAAALRVTTFGHAAEGTSDCPACGLAHEIDPPLAAIVAAPPVDAAPWPLSVGGYELRVRVPDSRDQAAITFCDDAAEARRVLVARCVMAATRDGAPVDPAALPEAVVVELGDALAERDGFAEVLIALRCAGCGQPWTLVFETGEFLWREVVMHARRLLREVDLLARTYHWSEAEVLAMSAQRRQAYLDLVSA